MAFRESFPKPFDVNIDRAAVPAVVCSPEQLDELLPCIDPPGIASQLGEQLELSQWKLEEMVAFTISWLLLFIMTEPSLIVSWDTSR